MPILQIVKWRLIWDDTTKVGTVDLDPIGAAPPFQLGTFSADEFNAICNVLSASHALNAPLFCDTGARRIYFT